MALFSNTLSVVRQYLSSAVGDLISSTAATPLGAEHYTDSSLLKSDDYYNQHNYRGYCYNGTAIGQEREVYDWVYANRLILFSPSFSPAIASGDNFELHRIFSEDEYRKAINLAIGSVAETYLIDKIDAGTTLVANTHEYTLPTDMTHIHRITTERTAGGGIFDETDVIDSRDWDLISPRKLKLHEDRYSVVAGKDLRIEGQSRQATVSSDTDVIELPLDWLVQKAITALPDSKIQSNALTDTYKRALIFSKDGLRTQTHSYARRIVE